MALSARSGIKDKRPPPEDSNIWRKLNDSRQGYKFAARTLSRILRMVRAAGSRSTAGPQKADLYQKAIWLLWSSERENSFLTLENRRGTPAFPVLEVDGILFLSGRKLSDCPPFDQPSAHQQDQHLITPAPVSPISSGFPELAPDPEHLEFFSQISSYFL